MAGRKVYIGVAAFALIVDDADDQPVR